MGRSNQEIKYVYAVKSAAFPGLIKIGRTQNMRERLSQLNTSCAPAPFVVVAVSPTLDNVLDEKMAHDFFLSQRREGEFFSVPESEVIDFFKTIQEKFGVESSQTRVVDPAADAAKKAQVQALQILLFGKLAKQQMERERNMPRASQAELDSVQQQEPVDSALDNCCRKRKRDREDYLFELEIAEREVALEKYRLEVEEHKMGLEERKQAHYIKLIEHINTAIRSIGTLMDLPNVDESTKKQAKDLIKNVVFDKTSVPLISQLQQG